MPDIFTSHKEKKEEQQQEQPKAPEVTPEQSSIETKTVKHAATPHEKAKQVIEELESNHPDKKSAKLESAEKHVTQVLEAPHKSVGLLTHYCENPTGIKFVNQEENETILLFIRRHVATNVPWLIIFFLLLLLPIIVFALFRISNFTLFSIPTSLVLVLLSFYYLIVFNYALLNFIDWFYDIGILTKKRLIDLDAENILQHHLAETEIEDIVDVSYAQRGFFQSFFNFGDIHIQTEALKANFGFEAAPKPSDVSDIISDLKVVTKGE